MIAGGSAVGAEAAIRVRRRRFRQRKNLKYSVHEFQELLFILGQLLPHGVAVVHNAPVIRPVIDVDRVQVEQAQLRDRRQVQPLLRGMLERICVGAELSAIESDVLARWAGGLEVDHCVGAVIECQHGIERPLDVARSRQIRENDGGRIDPLALHCHPSGRQFGGERTGRLTIEQALHQGVDAGEDLGEGLRGALNAQHHLEVKAARAFIP